MGEMGCPPNFLLRFSWENIEEIISLNEKIDKMKPNDFVFIVFQKKIANLPDIRKKFDAISVFSQVLLFETIEGNN